MVGKDLLTLEEVQTTFHTRKLCQQLVIIRKILVAIWLLNLVKLISKRGLIRVTMLSRVRV